MNSVIVNLKIYFLIFSLTGCSGLKVINPNDNNPNAGTLALDLTNGDLKLVATYTCTLQSMGKEISAVAKTEEDARKEVVAKCHDRTVISFCQPEKVKCVKN